ncbi:MAG: DUF2975 domain-containing protein [Bacteroidota bacterium]
MKIINSKIIHALYRCFQIGFVLHLLAVGCNLYYHFYNDGFMIASQVRVSTGNFRDQVNFDSIIRQEPGARATLFRINETHAAIRYDGVSSLNGGALTVLFISMLNDVLWLAFTWLLLLVFKSLKYNGIFENSNIIRLRLIALIVGASPLLQLTKNILFAEVLKNQVSLKHHYISFSYNYSLFSGCLYMVLILVLVEIFRYGMGIKSENDLTV